MLLKLTNDRIEYLKRTNIKYKEVLVKNGKIVGKIGEETDGTYLDGSKIHVGDLVVCKSKYHTSGCEYVLKDKGRYEIMGLYGVSSPKNGVIYEDERKRENEKWTIVKHIKFNKHNEEIDPISKGIMIDCKYDELLKKCNLKIGGDEL